MDIEELKKEYELKLATIINEKTELADKLTILEKEHLKVKDIDNVLLTEKLTDTTDLIEKMKKELFETQKENAKLVMNTPVKKDTDVDLFNLLRR